jgi:deoxyribonuclease-4
MPPTTKQVTKQVTRTTKQKRTRKVAPKIGFHAPIKGGVHNALIVAKDTGCDTVQLFSRNPRGWLAKPLTLDDVLLFRNTRRATKISPVLIHCNYLVNLATADDAMLQKSRESFREEVERALLLGVDYLVVHPGSSRGACETDGIALCAASLRIACKGMKLDSLRILLENTAGQGDCIGHRFEHLREIMNACPKLPLGVCLDTAHAFTAGYDIREADGLEALLQRVQKTVGLKNVRAIHFNDSRAVYNSRVDRHWHIGEGHIGAEALRRVAQHPKLKHAAFILETPYDDPRADLKNLTMLRSFVTDLHTDKALL